MANEPTRPSVDDEAIRALIRRKALALIGRGGFRRQDRGDIEADLTLCLLQRLPAFDARRGTLAAFAAKILKGCAANLLRDRIAEKRDYRRTVPLASGEGPSADDALGRPQQDARLGRVRRDEEELAALALDVAEILDRLPPKAQRLARRLMRQSPSEAARALGVPRTTLNDRVKQLLRPFEDAGLDEYLRSSAVVSRRDRVVAGGGE